MYEIRDWLYIGKFSQTRNLSMLKQVGITAMLQLADYIPQPDMPILYLDVTDGESVPHDLIAEGVQFVREQKQAGKRILVACGAGISRSALFVVATLMEDENRTLFDAYHEVYSMYRGANQALYRDRTIVTSRVQD
ncbi:MAG: dual specificity protein phosphatase, partial [Chloroflexota bacterium]